MRVWKTLDTDNLHVGIVVATYGQAQALRSLAHAFLAQTYGHFTLYLVHDGPWLETAPELDRRTVISSTPNRENVFGHNCREVGRRQALEAGCDVIGFTNGDNWYCPVYLEAMLAALKAQQADLVYCNAIHSHKLWQPLKTRLTRGKIDVGCWLAKSDLLRDVPWNDHSFVADWFYLDKVLAKRPKVAKVKEYLFVHN